MALYTSLQQVRLVERIGSIKIWQHSSRDRVKLRTLHRGSNSINLWLGLVGKSCWKERAILEGNWGYSCSGRPEVARA